MNQQQLETEARAKIVWGEPIDEVQAFLISNGMEREYAKALITSCQQERLDHIRHIGVRKIVTGGVFLLAPVIAFATFRLLGFFFVRVMGIAFAIAALGLWRLIDGLRMNFWPSSEAGDLTEHS